MSETLSVSSSPGKWNFQVDSSWAMLRAVMIIQDVSSVHGIVSCGPLRKAHKEGAILILALYISLIRIC